MKIGYACLTIGVPNANLKSCMLKSVTEDRLREIIAHNLNALETILEYNHENKIQMFRISSDIIPFGSSQANTLVWWNEFASQLAMIGKKIRHYEMRVSMHPGQYTVINSLDEQVVNRAIKDLAYHNQFLDALMIDSSHKIVLHIGGIYQDKEQAIQRFITTYHKLSPAIKKRLVLENDDKLYHIMDVLQIAREVGAPVIFDNLHHAIHPCPLPKDEIAWIWECKATWKEFDGDQKIHYSQKNPKKRLGSHSTTIRVMEFMDFFCRLQRTDIDIMLEVKDKNLSAVKIIHCIHADNTSKELEQEWKYYQHSVLEHSPQNYECICSLLDGNSVDIALAFYQSIEQALATPVLVENAANAAKHVWSLFEEIASEKEKHRFFQSIKDYRNGQVEIKSVKRILRRLTVTYNQSILYHSHYFIEDDDG